MATDSGLDDAEQAGGEGSCERGQGAIHWPTNLSRPHERVILMLDITSFGTWSDSIRLPSDTLRLRTSV